MSTINVYVTRKIPEAGIQLLQDKGYNVEIHNKEYPPSKEELQNGIKNADAIISLLSDDINKEIIDCAQRLRIIANYAVGYNNVDIKYASSKNIAVTNTPDVLTEATADLTWALILSISKRIVESDQYTRAGKFQGWAPQLLLGGEVTGKTLGLIGAGRIGQAVGQRALGFNMSVLYSGSNIKSVFERETGAKKVNLEQLLKNSDFITIHCPLNDRTQHLINHKNIFSIKAGAYLINTSRGPVIEESALVKALAEGHLAGAGLDVYEFEPKITRELFDFPNVILLPHIGSATFETRSEMARIAARNVISFLENGKAINPVL